MSKASEKRKRRKAKKIPKQVAQTNRKGTTYKVSKKKRICNQRGAFGTPRFLRPKEEE